MPVDVICWGRFYDFFEKRDGRWAIVRRQPIYEKDRLDPVDPAADAVRSTRAFSRSFPEGYRHLAYLQAKVGFNVKEALPGVQGRGRGEAVRRGRGLAGGARRRPASRCKASVNGAGSRPGSGSREAGAARRWRSPGTTCGLLVGDRQAAVRRRARRSGAHRAVLAEAVAGGYDTVLTHHPLLFSPLTLAGRVAAARAPGAGAGPAAAST